MPKVALQERNLGPQGEDYIIIHEGGDVVGNAVIHAVIK